MPHEENPQQAECKHEYDSQGIQGRCMKVLARDYRSISLAFAWIISIVG